MAIKYMQMSVEWDDEDFPGFNVVDYKQEILDAHHNVFENEVSLGDEPHVTFQFGKVVDREGVEKPLSYDDMPIGFIADES